MQNINSSSFCFGALYGSIAVGFIALIANHMRQARVQMGLRNRSLDNFPDTAQPDMTSSGVVRTSQAATVRYILLLFVLIFVVVLAIFGIVLIFQG